jgi:N-terminal acetyltransferase B complex catalytic subunit
MGYARRLTESLERASDINDAWFVDLYVRESNKVAVGMYKGMGYGSTFALMVTVVSRLTVNVSCDEIQILRVQAG